MVYSQQKRTKVRGQETELYFRSTSSLAPSMFLIYGLFLGNSHVRRLSTDSPFVELTYLTKENSECKF